MRTSTHARLSSSALADSRTGPLRKSLGRARSAEREGCAGNSSSTPRAPVPSRSTTLAGATPGVPTPPDSSRVRAPTGRLTLGIIESPRPGGTCWRIRRGTAPRAFRRLPCPHLSHPRVCSETGFEDHLHRTPKQRRVVAATRPRSQDRVAERVGSGRRPIRYVCSCPGESEFRPGSSDRRQRL